MVRCGIAVAQQGSARQRSDPCYCTDRCGKVAINKPHQSHLLGLTPDVVRFIFQGLVELKIQSKS